ncbi:MAG TPA: zinc ribbon domain-containing protein [Anaerolineae bacterium]|nr:zinc ribbon domain-containing protein [Anaerolineae bacterium]
MEQDEITLGQDVSSETCPSCGRPVQADWQVCPYCGQGLV